jgi:chemotaxis protein methyltransferase CheR
MPLSMPDSLYEQFSETLSQRMGLYFARDRWADLERGMLAVAADLGMADVTSCVRHLLATEWDRPHIEMLASHLTIGETYFFREPKSFEALSQRILPDLIRSRQGAGRDIHIWSAACCSGEEAYSLAMLLDMLIPDRTSWTIRILATDINPSFLRRAADGIYGEWSFRGVPDDIKKKYFVPTSGGAYTIVPRIKKMVAFSYGNLVGDSLHSPNINNKSIDILFCRNVLMYFNEDAIRKVIDHFHQVLNDDGWLFPSSVEGAPALFTPFTYVNVDGATLYRKEASAARIAAPPVPVPLTLLPSPPETGTRVEVAAVLPRPAPPAVLPPPARSSHAEASALYGEGRYGEAAALLLAHLQVEPENAACMLLLARGYANQGYLFEALDWCRRAIACNRLNASGHYLLAMVQQELNELAEAAVSLQRTLFLDPHFVLAHFALADLARSQGKPSEASRHYRNAAALLEGRDATELLPDSDGMSVGRLLELARLGSASGTVAGLARNG